MSEKFLHYIWFKRLFFKQQRTTDGQQLEIIDLGQPNSNAGADVFNAKIKIGNTFWAGNVEFHTCASHWKSHNHHTDKAYDSVILHVVLEDDGVAHRTNKTIVPQLVIKYDMGYKEQFDDIDLSFIPCQDKLLCSDKKNMHETMKSLVSQRLETKFQAIENILNQTSNDWEEAFYITTARSLGFGINTNTFELLAKRIQQKILAKHKDNLLQIEALLFGVAGFLETDMSDSYFNALKTEYQYLKHKYNLQTIEVSQWKFLRLRPTNFPTIRIAQFANLIHKNSKLFSKIIYEKSYKNLIKYYLSLYPSDYWNTHYLFGKTSDEKSKRISKTSIDIIIINSVVPFLYAYGKKFNQEDKKELAFELLQTMPAEKNHITKGFSLLKIDSKNAFQSQALNELKIQYCDKKKCYICKNKFALC